MNATTLALLCGLSAPQSGDRIPHQAGDTCQPAASAQREGEAPLQRELGSPEARQALARVAFAEAGNQGDSGLAGVVYTVINRLASGRWGRTVQAVVDAPHQFEPVMRAGGTWRRLPVVSAAQQARIDTILNLALDGRLPDLTGGARYFQNPRIVARRAAAGQVSAHLVGFGGAMPTAVIGAHSFYAEPAGRQLSGAKSAIGLPVDGSGLAPDAIFVGENRAGGSAATVGPVEPSQLVARALVTPGKQSVQNTSASTSSLAAEDQSGEAAGGGGAGSRDPGLASRPQGDGRAIFVLSDGSLAEDRRSGSALPLVLQR